MEVAVGVTVKVEVAAVLVAVIVAVGVLFVKVEIAAVEVAVVIFGALLDSGNVLTANCNVRIALLGSFGSPTWLKKNSKVRTNLGLVRSLDRS